LDSPPLPEQKAIAEVLSSLDDKIDLLTRQNKTLEDLAQTYFRKWFVETEVQTGRLDSIAEIIMGQSPKGDNYNEDGLGTVFFQGRAEFGWRFPTVRLYTTSPQRMAKKGDILMSVRAPVGDINIAAEDCCIGRGLAAIRSEYPTFTLYAIKEQQEQLDIFNGEGTVFGSITKDGLSSLSIPMPDKKRIQEFEDRFSILDEKIKENSNQILTLQKLCDTLLPKLLSGEVRVSQ
jgi:type I restriction enzyme S subunit